MTEIRALTGLRGLAALIVFWTHTRIALAAHGLHFEMPVIVERLLLGGGRQVDIFFVLSGFIMALIYRRWFAAGITGSAYRQFLRRRLARIWPLHMVMLLLVVAAMVAGHQLGLKVNNGVERFDYAVLPEHVLMVHAWRASMEVYGTWNPPSWSVSIEWLAYFLFPMLIWCTERWASRPFVPIALAVAIGFWLNTLTIWGQYGMEGIARGLSEFTLGCLLANLHGGPLARWLQTGRGSWLATGLLIGGFALVPDTGFIVGVLTAPLLLALSGTANAPAVFFGSRVMFFLGEISYSIYLGHFLFTSVAYRLISVEWMKTGPLETVVGLLLINAFVVAAATATYYLIERPGRDWIGGRRPAKSSSAATSGVMS